MNTIIENLKKLNCDVCGQEIEINQKFSYSTDIIEGYFYELNSCMDCHKQSIECDKGEHDFVEKVNTVWEKGVPFPEYTGKEACSHCGISKEEYELSKLPEIFKQ